MTIINILYVRDTPAQEQITIKTDEGEQFPFKIRILNTR
jgi:hypothetical protein